MKQANQSMELRDLMDMFGFKNLITSPTCYKNPHNHTLVDVLLSNNPRKYCSSGIIQNGLSDVHHFIYGVLSQKQTRHKAKTVVYRSVKSFDPDSYKMDLAMAPFHVGAIFEDVEDKFWFFQTLITDVLNQHAPIKSKRVRPVQPPFMNSRLRKNVHLKAQLRNRFNKYPNRRNWDAYRIQHNRTTQIH
jgi:hypothetical protein